jgi:hypothetical protein
MVLNQMKQSSPVFLRLQANRCQQLSRSCTDLGTARALRLMAEEYAIEASRPETRASAPKSQPRASVAKRARMAEPSFWRPTALPIVAQAATLQGAAIGADTGALIAASPGAVVAVIGAVVGGLNIVKL